jgi:hypothetical protein
MAYRPHSVEQYNLLFHVFWCQRRPLAEAAKEALMNETHAFRACTGWSSGKDGAVGRTAFLAWIRDMKSPEGAPCCGGMMHVGKRRPRSFTDERLRELEKLREVEKAHEQLISELAKMRKSLGLKEGQSVDAAPRGVRHDHTEEDERRGL